MEGDRDSEIINKKPAAHPKVAAREGCGLLFDVNRRNYKLVTERRYSAQEKSWVVGISETECLIEAFRCSGHRVKNLQPEDPILDNDNANCHFHDNPNPIRLTSDRKSIFEERVSAPWFPHDHGGLYYAITLSLSLVKYSSGFLWDFCIIGLLLLFMYPSIYVSYPRIHHPPEIPRLFPFQKSCDHPISASCSWEWSIRTLQHRGNATTHPIPPRRASSFGEASCWCTEVCANRRYRWCRWWYAPDVFWDAWKLVIGWLFQAWIDWDELGIPHFEIMARAWSCDDIGDGIRVRCQCSTRRRISHHLEINRNANGSYLVLAGWR